VALPPRGQLGHGGLQMAASCAAVLTYLNVRSAPVLETHHFRLALTKLAMRRTLWAKKEAPSEDGA
jgi:hypothetical protein